MKDRSLVLGIDVSKKKFDVALMQGENKPKLGVFMNNSNGYKT